MGGGGGQGQTSYTYAAAIMFGLCEGPVLSVPRVWSGKDLTTLDDLNMSIILGNQGQTPWSYLTSNHPDQALGYTNMCVAVSPLFDLGDQSALPNFSFEVVGPGRLPGSDDAMPDYIVNDLLANQMHGSGWSSSNIGDLAQYALYCKAAGLLLSPAFTEQNDATELVKGVLEATNSEAVWSQNKLKIIPYADAAITGNGVTFTPNITPIYDLNDDDFLSDDDDPVRCSRISTADAYNHVQIEFCNRLMDYNVDIAEAKDQADIEANGLRTLDPIQMHMICLPSIARTVAQLVLQRKLYIRNTYSFDLGWKYCRLEPMDLVTITDSVMGLDKVPVLIKTVTEADDESGGHFTIEAEEYPFGVNSHAIYPHQSSLGYIPDYQADPGNANIPVIFEPPYQLVSNGLEIWLYVSGGANWGGCDVWVSEDNITYSKVGRVTGGSRQGVLTAAFSSSANSLTVDLSMGNSGALLSGTANDAASLNTLCLVDNELFAYQTATLVASNRYSLSGLVRGAYDTVASNHAIGSSFARLDDSVFKYSFRRDQIGKTIYIKMVSFNIYGGANQFIENVSPVSYVVTGSAPPSPCSSFLVNRQPDGTRQFTWIHPAETGDLAGYRIHYILGTSGTFNTMGELHTGLLTSSPYETNQLAAGTYTFAIVAEDTSGNQSTPLYIQTTLGDPRLAGVLVDKYPDREGWPGNKANCYVDEMNRLVSMDLKKWSDFPADGVTWATWTSWARNPNPLAKYTTEVIDLGVAATFTPLVTVVSNGSQVVEMNQSSDNITWGGWVAPGLTTTRYVKIRVSNTVASGLSIITSIVIYLNANINIEYLNDITMSALTGAYRIGVGNIRLPIKKTPALIKTVNITLQNVGPGWSSELIDKNTAIGPQIKIYNASNVLADCVIDAEVKELI